MRKPRSRRALLASLPPAAAAITGCFEGRVTSSDDELDSGVVPTDAYDCATLERPEPEPSDSGDALEPASYPDPPGAVLEDAEDYVREFEAAYRRNSFVAQFGADARGFAFEFERGQQKEVETESDRDAALVAFVYTLKTERRYRDERTEWDTRVTYYVDEHVAFRARYDGLADDPAFEPDPRHAGEPVACFD